MRPIRVFLAVVAVTAALTWAFDSPIEAQRGAASGVVVLENRGNAAAYWTPERMAAARSLELIPAVSPLASYEPDLTGTPMAHDGWAAGGSAPTSPVKLYDPVQASLSGIEPQWFGTSGARFTSSRLIPNNTTSDQAYPNRVIGKLFFTIPNQGGFVCSASIISYRILATAGHCVASGTGTWYGNFQFVPALRSGSGPWGTYGWAYATTTSTWFSGGGGVPNAADYAMIETADKPSGRIGALLGWLGWQTLSLSGNQANLMGYPCNLDACNAMHQVTSHAFSNAANNTVTYGSNMRGGSSGGPWIMNFGELATCSSGCGGSDTGVNRVIAVTSYGPTATDPLYEGASIPDSRWVTLWNTACGHRTGNC